MLSFRIRKLRGMEESAWLMSPGMTICIPKIGSSKLSFCRRLVER